MGTGRLWNRFIFKHTKSSQQQKVEGFYHYGFRADSGNQQKSFWQIKLNKVGEI